MLLFDENLSPKLVERIADIFPKSLHVVHCGLGQSLDSDIWEYAQRNDLTIISQDTDFVALSERFGFPPKVIVLRVHNEKTSYIELLIRSNENEIKKFIASPKHALFIV